MLFKAREKDILFKMLLDMSTEVQESAQYFFDFRIKEKNHLYEFYTTVKGFEEKSHEQMVSFSRQLNKALITPIEREDMLYLADHMDGIIHWMEESASRFEMYNVHNITDEMRQFTEYVNKCTHEIHACIEALSDKKFVNMNDHIIKVSEYKAICDVLKRQAIKHLFVEFKEDPIQLMQYKEIYETLGNCVDHCKDVAKVLESIIMKNA